MARTESIAVAGYYPTPPDLVPEIVSLLEVDPQANYAFLDPCAGEGAAILNLILALHEGREHIDSDLYAVELEKGRHETFTERFTGYGHEWRWRNSILHGDAFRAAWKSPQIGLLWLNPPYDTDPIHGRLEEKFLTRFTQVLVSGGVLVFLVPFYALKASALTLATEYENLTCYRFPEEEWEAYKQVVLFAERRSVSLSMPDPALEAQIREWASNPESMPVLNPFGKTYVLPQLPRYSHGFEEWRMTKVDVQGILKLTRPWHTSDRRGNPQRIPGLAPESKDDLLIRRYPIAMPPRSAHIAAGIASGIFNGSRITPDDPKSKLPPILVKGAFDKEYRTVDEKTDKQGNVTGLIQVQKPKLVTTVLDLNNSRYVTIKPSADLTHTASLEDMTMADFLHGYGQGLMKVMLQQCPVMHDPNRPEDEIPLPPLARPLFKAQGHAAQCAIKLLGGLNVSKRARRYKGGYILGEVGTGKTSTALAVAQAIKAKRVIVSCPPHLLDSWKDETASVTPWVKVVVLDDVQDVRELASDTDDQIIAILSRETAKLGHGLEEVLVCGRCGTPVPPGTNAAKKRARCEARRLLPTGPLGRAILRLAYDLAFTFPESTWITEYVRSRPIRQMITKRLKREEVLIKNGADASQMRKSAWHKFLSKSTLTDTVDAILAHPSEEKTREALQALFVAHPDIELIKKAAASLYNSALSDENCNYNDPDILLALSLLLLIEPSKINDFAAYLESRFPKDVPHYSNPWGAWHRKQRSLWEGGPDSYSYEFRELSRTGNHLYWGKRHVGDNSAIMDAIGHLGPATIKKGKKCKEPLFQAKPRPRRYPLATFIARRHPDLFDLFIHDEAHEAANDGSAQEKAAHRFTALGIPTLKLTGTGSNGYAESMFTNTWAISADFRNEFGRDEISAFTTRYGFRKRYVEEKDADTGEVIEYGSVTDRVQRSERVIGRAPGILPLFLFRHLLPIAVTLHKSDLSVDIPDCEEIVAPILPDPEQVKKFEQLKSALVAQIKEDRFEEDLSGKLWGAMAELPSYLDLATSDTGNTDGGDYVIKYPESVGGKVIERARAFPASKLLPKEEWMLDRVEASLAEGRNVLVFAWHTRLIPRLARLLEQRLGETCPILDPAKVPTKKRQAWINKEVIAKKRRVMVVNPVTVQTGLNNLVYFSDEIWMENPGCNPTIYRQAVGRVDRINQKNKTRIYFPIYEGTAQQDLHSLLLHKVAVSMSTDGLDAEGALRAAGVLDDDDDGFSSFAVGRQLYEMITSRSPVYATN